VGDRNLKKVSKETENEKRKASKSKNGEKMVEELENR
jgi:hypothetical protein